MARFSVPAILVFSCFVFGSAQLHAGQYSDHKRRVAAEIEESKKLRLPMAPRPVPDGLDADWKQKVYNGIVGSLSERKRNAHHYLFLDPPTPCTVTQGRTFKFIGKPKVTTGLGGLVAVRRDGMVLDSYELLFYLLDDNGTVQQTIYHHTFGSYTIEPELFRHVRFSESQSGYLPLVSPPTILKMAAFRKAKIKELPLFE